VAARGSSDNAGRYAKYLFGARNRRVVALATPSLFTWYRRPPDLRGCLVLAISQSGASDDIRAVVAEGKRQGAPTLAITNEEKSPLAGEADQVILLHAGQERSVAATKTYTATLLALAMLSTAMRGTTRDWEALSRVPGAIQSVLERKEDFPRQALFYRAATRLVVIARGYNYATSFEIALKLTELAYLTAEPFSSADFRHGPIAMVQERFPVLLLGPRGKTSGDILALAQALTGRGADLLTISESRALRALSTHALPAPSPLPEWLSPISYVVPGQLFAMHLAHARGCPLDHPRALSKVTRTV